MQSENLECQIAQAQMGRYLGGEGLSNEAIVELEAHVRSCVSCKEAIQARRRSLESVLSLPTIEDFPARDVTTQIKPAGMPWVDAIKRLPNAPVGTATSTAESRPKKWRTPVMTAGLVGVLFLMASYPKEPTKVFGDRAMTQRDSIVKPNPSTIAGNGLSTVTTEGGSPITIKEQAPSFTPTDFIPEFILSRAKNTEPGTADMELTRQVMELELQKFAAKEAKTVKPTRRKSRNVVRVYAPEN